jgi:hypothetical protein
MDDLIFKAAIWQDEQWVDRSTFLKVQQSSERTKGAAKVVLLSLDRNRVCPFFFFPSGCCLTLLSFTSPSQSTCATPGRC